MLPHCVHTGDFSAKTPLDSAKGKSSAPVMVCFHGGEMEGSLVKYMLINKRVGDEGLNG